MEIVDAATAKSTILFIFEPPQKTPKRYLEQPERFSSRPGSASREEGKSGQQRTRNVPVVGAAGVPPATRRPGPCGAALTAATFHTGLLRTIAGIVIGAVTVRRAGSTQITGIGNRNDSGGEGEHSESGANHASGCHGINSPL